MFIIFSLQNFTILLSKARPLVWMVFPTLPVPKYFSWSSMAFLKKENGSVRGSPPCHMNHAPSYSSDTRRNNFSNLSKEILPPEDLSSGV